MTASAVDPAISRTPIEEHTVLGKILPPEWECSFATIHDCEDPYLTFVRYVELDDGSRVRKSLCVTKNHATDRFECFGGRGYQTEDGSELPTICSDPDLTIVLLETVGECRRVEADEVPKLRHASA